MDTLPVESLYQIFINLPFKDRIKCTLVCRQWYNTLNQRNLLYNLYIFKQQYSKSKDMLELLPHRAAQVQELELAFCFNPDFDKRALLSMFPNLRYLNLTEMSNSFPAKDYISRLFQFMHSTSKLKSVCDIGECELTFQLAISNLGQNLKLLDLVFRHLPTGSCDRITIQLKNMPILQCLKLSGCLFDLMNIDPFFLVKYLVTLSQQLQLLA